nr:MAG TPA_asm: hypothetical protein [Caudoviricetes sp.]
MLVLRQCFYLSLHKYTFILRKNMNKYTKNQKILAIFA